MIDILVYLFTQYGDFASRPKADKLARKLKAAGFELDDIADTLRWLGALQTREATPPPARADGFRVWSPIEVDRFGSEGLRFMAFLEQAGVLDPTLREVIADRVLAFPGDESPLALDQIKVVTLMVLWSQERETESLLIDELLAGPERTVH